MKKIICLALVFIMLLSGCSEWNVEIVDPTKPVSGESELAASENEKEEKPENEEQSKEPEQPEEEPYTVKPVEKSEAKSFFSDRQSFEDMAFLAGWFGTTDFESTEELANSYSLRYFVPEIYEILGDEALDENDFIKIPRSIANRYFIKYFGIGYEPEENDLVYDPETDSCCLATYGEGPKELLSYSHLSNVFENRFSVKLLVLEYQDELGKHFAYSEIVFEVMEDNNGKFLRLVSNKVIEHFGEASFEMQAQSLTKHMLMVMNKNNIEGENLEVTDGVAANFVMHAAICANVTNAFDKNSPYVGSFGMKEGYRYYLPISEIEKIAYEVFGIENFAYDFGSNFEYDPEKDEYITGFEWGMGSGYNAKDMTTTVDGNNYSVEFTLRYIGTNSEGDPEWMDGEKYIMNFELTEGEFLRYIGFEKA